MITSPRAVIDIGSNAIRLVVYGGPPRAPMPIYNEKARIGLGDSVARTGGIEPKLIDAAILALRRFDSLTTAMQVGQRRVVATEATRRASNSAEFLARAADAGIEIELISGETEALAAAMGVVCDTPSATGHVVDQGGGSLELARISDTVVMQPISMPFGTIPVSARAPLTSKQLALDIEKQLQKAQGPSPVKALPEKGLPLHLVGGAWRTLARLHMQVTGYPLAVLSNYHMALDSIASLWPVVGEADALAATGIVSSARLPHMAASLTTVEALVRVLRPSEVMVSVYGLREGLLYDQLSQAVRDEDPLIAAARHEGKRLSRFSYHGDAIADWTAPLFEADPPSMQRLRYAACLLADCAWNSHPEYRSQHAAELALEGNWPGMTASDRAMLSAALFASYGGNREPPPLLGLLASPQELQTARRWGLAIRLAQRLDGGTGVGLTATQLSQRDGTVRLDYAAEYKHFSSPSVKRRLKQLSDAMATAQ
jgi:exopolyphosphatase / guanosine-5'-triphosphate,3'-diphosphate pyrophosphatase